MDKSVYWIWTVMISNTEDLCVNPIYCVYFVVGCNIWRETNSWCYWILHNSLYPITLNCVFWVYRIFFWFGTLPIQSYFIRIFNPALQKNTWSQYCPLTARLCRINQPNWRVPTGLSAITLNPTSLLYQNQSQGNRSAASIPANISFRDLVI